MTVIFFTAIIGSYFRSNLFLFCVAFFTYYACITAYRSLKLKKLHLKKKLFLKWRSPCPISLLVVLPNVAKNPTNVDLEVEEVQPQPQQLSL